MAEASLSVMRGEGDAVPATSGYRDPVTGRPRCSNSRDEMYEIYQSWALQNYGDTGKTKTVTKRKYKRIVGILTGEEPATSENSKFRFWVKAKGFRLGPPAKDVQSSEQTLYIPTKSEQEDGEKIYKRVAIVEDFFDIIYNVHVEMDGRGGKHAGQKRTYRAIAETYSFLPREAVTRFLMSCADCQKRMHLSMETNNNGDTPGNHVADDPPIIDFSLPITTTYLNHMKSKKGFLDENYVYHADGEESMSSVTSHPASLDRSPSPALVPERYSPKPAPESANISKKAELADVAETKPSLSPASLQLRNRSSMTEKMDTDESVTVSERNGNGLAETEDQKPLNMAITPAKEDKGHPERKRRASNDSLDSSTKASESAADDAKDEDDDNDEDEDEKLQSHQYDPERLKSFNMFVRLFVDENLDRSVPISKQPKDKIQAILEACDRQFPEFHERSRKRIRTYLKSCRRMRRSKEANGWEQLRPTPPHLTSAAAEGILAQACENESNNAKRMRMGLEPLPVNATVAGSGKGTASNSASNTPSQTSPHVSPTPSLNQPREREQTRQQQASPNGHSSTSSERQGSDFNRHTPGLPPPTGFRPPHELPSPFFTNSNGIFRPGFPSSYQHPAHQHPPSLHHASPIASQIQNGPTDLSMKGGTGGKAGATSKNQLNPTEVATIKQLIAGYRESAAFLYRSADELEQLLLQQN